MDYTQFDFLGKRIGQFNVKICSKYFIQIASEYFVNIFGINEPRIHAYVLLHTLRG